MNPVGVRTLVSCPVDRCDWRHIEQRTSTAWPDAPNLVAISSAVSAHLAEHSAVDYLLTIQRLRKELHAAMLTHSSAERYASMNDLTSDSVPGPDGPRYLMRGRCLGDGISRWTLDWSSRYRSDQVAVNHAGPVYIEPVWDGESQVVGVKLTDEAGALLYQVTHHA